MIEIFKTISDDSMFILYCYNTWAFYHGTSWNNLIKSNYDVYKVKVCFF